MRDRVKELIFLLGVCQSNQEQFHGIFRQEMAELDGMSRMILENELQGLMLDINDVDN